MMNVPPESNAPEARGAQVCARCGAPFRCGKLAGDAVCWCAGLPALPVDRLRPGMSCLCPACLAAEIERIARSD
ncbi:cysteine-rich CWC family protein [Caballeronia calidae]|uniref:cysteine-rich CWC family protein n=1 Tax=Caballeronia calidae TaxID=1777139 RepID=UPI000787370A|nr:cysteine-rich CWC family protein [Caballeronia calidae]